LADALVAKEVDKENDRITGRFRVGCFATLCNALKERRGCGEVVGAGYSERTAKEIAALESCYGISRKRGGSENKCNNLPSGTL